MTSSTGSCLELFETEILSTMSLKQKQKNCKQYWINEKYARFLTLTDGGQKKVYIEKVTMYQKGTDHIEG